jgi:thioredoxin reductase (NADPH)
MLCNDPSDMEDTEVVASYQTMALRLGRRGTVCYHPQAGRFDAPGIDEGGFLVKVHDVVILGSGPAGLTAAIYCGRANLEPVVIEGLSAGGQLMNTTDVENYPGFPEGVQGPELMELFKKQAERFGSSFIAGDATRIELSARPFRVWTDESELATRTIIVATGASPRTLGIPGEERYAGHGVSYCATCDGFFFRDQEIVVVGGGDTAMEEALFLTRFGSRVTIVHRRDKLRASKIMGDRALAHDKIELLWDSLVDEVLGDGTKVTSLRVRNVKTGETAERPCGGFFVAIGHEPNTALFRDVLAMNEQGYLEAGVGAKTGVEGVFIAGDVHDHTYRQAVTAAGAGCKAAIDCERWLEADH